MNPTTSAPKNNNDHTDPLEKIPVAGIVRFSSVDYPGKLAAVFFTQGCPWGCVYCHNAHLRPLEGETRIAPKDLRLFLEDRRTLLDAVVISGGEPTMHPELKEFILAIKDRGYAIGLHTNGMNPAGLEKVLPLCGWVGMDVKAPRKLYPAITGAHAFDQVMTSAKKLITGQVPYEFRMTFHPALLSEEDILEVAEDLASMGAEKFILQRFRAQGCANADLCKETLTSSLEVSRKLKNRLTKLFPVFVIRG